jgi:thiosulfate reductase cytochrome b subunit
MSDIPSAFWLLGSAFFAVKYYSLHGFREIFLSVLFGSLSVFTRYAAIVPVAIIFMGLTYLWLKNIRWLHLFCLLLPVGFFVLHLFFNQASVDPCPTFSGQ